MRKFINYFMYFWGFFFLLQSNVLAFSCDYNISGYKDDDINWTLDMDTGTAKMKNSLNSLMYDSNKSEDIINWNNSSYSYNAKGSSTCPKYLIQSKGISSIFFITDDRMFASDEASLNSILSEKEVQKNMHREVHVMQLATRTKSNTKGATCKYSGSFTNSYWVFDAGVPVDISLEYDADGNLLSIDSSINNKYMQYVTVSYSVYNTKIGGDTCNATMAICQASDNREEHSPFGSYTFYLSGVDRLAEDQVSYNSNDRCESFQLSDDSTDSNGDKVTSGEYCPAYDEYWDDLETAATSYGTCIGNGNSNCESYLSTFNQELSKLQAICKSAYSAMTYSDTCVKKCAKEFDENVFNLKKENNINIENNNANCGISVRVANWILKIINWLRYIVPVLLIILSTLDFIKAIAADSEDEVKKVASKFTKRLIVAVIIFLLPLALEFLLGIFGINTNNFCL